MVFMPLSTTFQLYHGGKRLKITNKELIKSSNSQNDRKYNNQTKKYKVQTDKKSMKMPKIRSLKQKDRKYISQNKKDKTNETKMKNNGLQNTTQKTKD